MGKLTCIDSQDLGCLSASVETAKQQRAVYGLELRSSFAHDDLLSTVVNGMRSSSPGLVWMMAR